MFTAGFTAGSPGPAGAAERTARVGTGAGPAGWRAGTDRQALAVAVAVRIRGAVLGMGLVPDGRVLPGLSRLVAQPLVTLVGPQRQDSQDADDEQRDTHEDEE